MPSTGSGDDQSEKTKVLEIDSDPAASNAHLVVQAEEDIAGIQKFLSADVAVQDMSPLGIAAGGSGHAFNAKDYTNFFGNAVNRGPEHYLEAKINMLWIGARSAGMTGVPWREEAIKDMAEHEALFQNNKYTEIMHVNVGRDPLKVDVSKVGLGRRMSPPELLSLIHI